MLQMRSLGILLFVAGTYALYDSSSDVIELTPSNFDRLVTKSDEIWIVEFYAPWCGHCKNLVPEYKKAARALKGIIKVGGVDADQHKDLAQRYGVTGFPTIKVFSGSKHTPYQGQRTAEGFVDAGIKAAKEKAYENLGKKSGGSSDKWRLRSGLYGHEIPWKPVKKILLVKQIEQPKMTAPLKTKRNNINLLELNLFRGKVFDDDPPRISDVITLTDSNFKELVLDSEDLWLVEFYAPWCGHCKNLEPHWAKAATELKGKVKVGALDATVHQAMASRYQVQGYPTIKLFNAGKKTSDSVEDYNGGRTSSDIVAYALEKLAENIAPPEIVQVVNEETMKVCSEKPLCVVSILPHILDCNAACRNDYIAILARLGDKYKNKMWGWVWTEAGAQPALEEALELGGFGYPAMAVVNAKKLKFSTLRGSFSETGINEFLRFKVYAEMPKISTTEPWAGKDGELPPEEDIDLSDVDLEKDEL
ncbi:Protein disulfide-isomerase A6 [Papilio machaon]|uniref:protein disulfide-isomerase n=1 Tax=Papilio machaon TaxID=76193 RepID=A0A194QVE7_PAPMA|nr:Protein disulfide-isomerase A6 [Papilio machaon]